MERASSLAPSLQRPRARSGRSLAYASALSGSTLKTIAVVVPLGLDTFAVALALGAAGLPARSRTRVALLFAGFEAAMPLIGVALGAPLGRAIGTGADYLAALLLIVLGAYMLTAEGGEPLALTRRRSEEHTS